MKVNARDVLHPADPLLTMLALAEDAQTLLASIETYIVQVHSAHTAEDRYQAATALANHCRAIQSKTKVAWDKAGKVQNLALMACKREFAIKHGSAAGSYIDQQTCKPVFDQRDPGDESEVA